MPIATTDEQLAWCASLREGAKSAGGTTQILLSMVAERVLGLPRDEVR